MSRVYNARIIGGLVSTAWLLLLGSVVLAADADTPQAELQPLPEAGLLTPPPARGGVELFNPITPYTLAKHPPTIRYAVYPVTYSADWTNWGPGCLHSNGRVYTAIGDHRGFNADSWLYEYDPHTQQLRWVASARASVASFEWGDYGFSKIHGRIAEGNDGKLYFASWWGVDQDSPKYRGDRIFCFDPASETLTDLGITVPGWGAPVTALDPNRLIFYGEFQHPTEERTEFVAYDLREGKILFRGGHEGDPKPGRALPIDAEGCVYFDRSGDVVKYDPRTNTITELPDKLPHPRLRQDASRRRPDGGIYVTTHADHSALLLLHPDTGRIEVVMRLWGDVKGLDLDPTGRFIYYVADSPFGVATSEDLLADIHLSAGLPVVQVDLAKGASQKVIAFLEIPLREALGWEPRGDHTCYNLLVGDDGRTLYFSLNGFCRCNLGYDHATPLFVVLQVPPEEIPGD